MTPERLAELEQHSAMLGRIASLVEPWCITENCTTADAVKLALCELAELRAQADRAKIYARYNF